MEPGAILVASDIRGASLPFSDHLVFALEDGRSLFERLLGFDLATTHLAVPFKVPVLREVLRLGETLSFR